jgi:hypothetical protein
VEVSKSFFAGDGPVSNVCQTSRAKESTSPEHPSLDGIHFEIDRCRLFLNRMILWTLATVFLIDAAFRMLDFA